MRLEIVTPEEHIYSGDIVSGKFPGKNGLFGVLKNHAPLISILEEGKIIIVEEENKSEKVIEIKGGVVEILNNRIIVLAE